MMQREITGFAANRRAILLGLSACFIVTGSARAQNLPGGLGDLLKKVPGAGSLTGSGSGLGSSEIVAGLKEALSIGSDRVVSLIGVADGFWSRPDIRIPLPDSLRSVQQGLSKVGLSGMVDDLELKLNRAAETATPRAKALFKDAISAMTVEDAKGILNGPQDAATQYFKGRMASPLKGEMRPIVDEELAKAGAVKAYDGMMGKYKALPFVPDAKADLTDHVLTRGIDGIFTYLGKEEAAIRQDPAKRTTDLLRKVFA